MRRQARSRISAGDRPNASKKPRQIGGPWSGCIPVSQGLMADHIRAFGQHLPDERGGLVGAEVHLVAGASLHLVKRRDRPALSRTARAAVQLSSRKVAAGRHAERKYPPFGAFGADTSRSAYEPLPA